MKMSQMSSQNKSKYQILNESDNGNVITPGRRLEGRSGIQGKGSSGKNSKPSKCHSKINVHTKFDREQTMEKCSIPVGKVRLGGVMGNFDKKMQTSQMASQKESI